VPRERIVITGSGAVSCCGCREDFIANVYANKSGIKACTRYDVSQLKSRLAGEIDYDQLYQILPNEDNVEKTIYLAYFATMRALAEAGLAGLPAHLNVAVVIGSLFGGFNTSVYVHERFLEDHKLANADVGIMDYFSPCSIPNYLAKKLRVNGPKMIVSNACASGGSAVGIAYDLIQAGLADMAIAGGADELNRLSLAGFNSLGALNPQNCTPYTNSAGITIGEGASIFVLEKLAAAQRRGCAPRAEIIGYELNSDAFHVTAPDPSGEGAFRAMKNVLERNNISVDEVSYINGHGTGTAANDTSEIKAVKRLYAENSHTGKLISNKGVIGHCMGAAGALELFVSVKSIEDHTIPPTYYGEKQTPQTDIEIVKEARPGPCNFILSNSFAFGGNNVCLGVSSPGYFAEAQLDNLLLDDEAVITGVGCIGNKHASWQEYLALLETNDSAFLADETYAGKYSSVYHGVIPAYDYRQYMSPDFFRKTDLISKLSMVSSASALKDANIKVTRANSERIGLIYGTGTGPTSTIEQLNLDIVQKGLAGMNAFFFPNSVNNASPGYITMNSRIKGATLTINCGGATFAAGILYARFILLQNKADYVIVTVTDDYNEIYHAAYEKLGLLNKTDKVENFFVSANTVQLSPGSVSVILERKSSAAARGAKAYAQVLGGTLSGDCNSINGLNLQSMAMYDAYAATLQAAGLNENDLDLYFSASTGIKVLDFIEKHKVINKCPAPIISSARQFCGYNISITPAYSVLSALASFMGYPLYDIVKKQTHTQNGGVNNALIASYAFGETYGNIVIAKP
jgi:3-oxoacyl-[acyl-carrier-protein] synthase II